MTLAPVDLAHVAGALTDRAYLLTIARWRRSRPRREVGSWMEAAILAALDRAEQEHATLRCATCEAFTRHGHEADVRDEPARQLVRLWRCGACGSVRQCGAVELEAAA